MVKKLCAVQSLCFAAENLIIQPVAIEGEGGDPR
jgi:hypothetical protein